MGKLIRAITSDGLVSVTAVDSTDIVGRAERIHKTSAVVTAALGRLLSAASLMGSALKDKENSITLRIKGDGEIGSIIAVSDSDGNVRGYACNRVVEIPLNKMGKLDVGGAIGRGQLSVSKDLGFGEPYNGTVELVSGEVAEDIAAYFAISEQIPTVCALGVLVNPDLTVKRAGGYLIQLLPAAGNDTIEMIERSVKGLPSVTQMLDSGMDIEQLARRTMSEFELEILDEQTVEYRCTCSRERVEKALISIGADELKKLMDEQELTEADCHFCNKRYRFNRDEIAKLIQQK